MEEDNLISLFSSIMTRQQEILIYMKEIISAETNIPVESIKDTNTFFELGLDSINAVYLLELAEQKYKITLSPLDFWDYPTLKGFTNKIVSDHFQK